MSINRRKNVTTFQQQQSLNHYLNSTCVHIKWFFRNKLSEKISSTEMVLQNGTRKNYKIWFLSTSGISCCGISQGKIISVNWLLCYRFFVDMSANNTHFFLLPPSLVSEFSNGPRASRPNVFIYFNLILYFIC